jgi:hypothetical protein
MSTLTQKRAFIKANKPLVTSQTLTNALIGKLTDDVADSLIVEIQDNPEYTELPVASETTTTAVELVGAESTEEFGLILNLPYAGKTKNGSAKFTYGDTFVVVGNDLRLKAMSTLVVGQMFALKADSIEDSQKGYFLGRMNWGANSTIVSLNEQIQAFQDELTTRSAQHALKYNMSLKDAKAELTAQSKADAIASLKLPAIQF